MISITKRWGPNGSSRTYGVKTMNQQRMDSVPVRLDRLTCGGRRESGPAAMTDAWVWRASQSSAVWRAIEFVV